ncbi:hypothetical protein QCE81_30825 [Caballeronia sp. LZ002]|nr:MULTISPECIES: hypothetical protein [unclassified Caballeronia]MDR5776240.1 hypothetical protein [Caballeronia sp. LZ002]MDR5851680.1 hypothetical protein [Caballeronia sp. LZ003]
MSWLFSRALVEEYSAAICLDGEPSAQLNVMPTPHRFWHNGKTMEYSGLSRFGLTSRLLTEQHGAELLRSYLAAFRAKTSASPEMEPGSTEPEADFGSKWRGSFAKYSQASCSWKTVQCSLLADLDEFSETWPRWGSMLSGVSYLRPMSAHHIFESASGLWPTPVASDTGSRQKRYAQGGMPLSLAVKLWPTPTAMTRTGGAALCKWGGSRSREKLRTMVTPEELNGPLNPQWVEWLMGWPIGWTDLQPLAMDKYREWLQQHSPCSPDDT